MSDEYRTIPACVVEEAMAFVKTIREQVADYNLNAVVGADAIARVLNALMDTDET